ncbi:hypothetical protein KIF59_10965 [Enterobacter cloacae subsp. cloacae]|nr:hypothetical protein [Enterobacter cloacae subsp. cloacae]
MPLLLYSQAATTKALMPAALMLGVTPLTAITRLLPFLPDRSARLPSPAAVEMDGFRFNRIR